MDTTQSPEIFIPNRLSVAVYNLQAPQTQVVLGPNGQHLISNVKNVYNVNS
jgi:hypothetical protein